MSYHFVARASGNSSPEEIDRHPASPRLLRAIEATADLATEAWAYFSELCESPIERQLLEEMLLTRYTVMGVDLHGFDILGMNFRWDRRPIVSHGIIAHPQSVIGDYRVDFLLDVLLPYQDGRKVFVIECDGHDFHDRTKEQAKRDRARDRYMVSQNIKVLRYTGSEIYGSPEIVWREIIDIITDGRGSDWHRPHATGA